ncbi:hypothetical protein SASPL_127847 [Salvia splendens]|uniref:Uncharacterized protein n=1 Tax=Salvia splendens TaxID=180675 RepID=A0A8X8XCN5_SALSN|nr:hypothetical protein SASPL_127847 [Salvia splendens]
MTWKAMSQSTRSPNNIKLILPYLTHLASVGTTLWPRLLHTSLDERGTSSVRSPSVQDDTNLFLVNEKRCFRGQILGIGMSPRMLAEASHYVLLFMVWCI